MTRRSLGWLTCVVALGVAALIIVISCQALLEAYGPGPPYYSRTTNMDKWSNPVPVLLIVDGVGLVIVGLLVRWGRRLLRTATA